MVFGLIEKDVLCTTMTMTLTVGVDLVFSFRGVKGGDLPVGRTHAHIPTSSPIRPSHTGIVLAHEGGFRSRGEGGPRTHHVRRRSPMHWRPQGR